MPDQVPTNFLAAAATQQFALAVDTVKSRLYVLENRAGPWFVSPILHVGRQGGGGKAREGDQRTLLGRLHPCRVVARDRLDRLLWCAGAFSADYPERMGLARAQRLRHLVARCSGRHLRPCPARQRRLRGGIQPRPQIH